MLGLCWRRIPYKAGNLWSKLL